MIREKTLSVVFMNNLNLFIWIYLNAINYYQTFIIKIKKSKSFETLYAKVILNYNNHKQTF